MRGTPAAGAAGAALCALLLTAVPSRAEPPAGGNGPAAPPGKVWQAIGRDEPGSPPPAGPSFEDVLPERPPPDPGMRRTARVVLGVSLALAAAAFALAILGAARPHAARKGKPVEPPADPNDVDGLWRRHLERKRR